MMSHPCFDQSPFILPITTQHVLHFIERITKSRLCAHEFIQFKQIATFAASFITINITNRLRLAAVP